MTLQEAKDQIAIQHGFVTWGNWEDESWVVVGTRRIHSDFQDEVAELYARSKWDEACEAQKLSTAIKPNYIQRILEKFNEEFIHVSDVAYLIHTAPKPEFKP